MYLSNVYFAIRGYFHGNVSHFWSLAVEEQFYLVWPWLVLFLPKRALLPTILILIFIGPLFRLIGFMVNLNQLAIWVLTPGLLDTFGLVSLLAYLKHREDKLSVSTKNLIKACFLVGVPLLLLTETLGHIDGYRLAGNVLRNTALALTFTWLIARASEGFRGFIGEALEFRPVVYLGKISYGIYVIHPFTPYLVGKVLYIFGLSGYSSKPILMVPLSTGITVIVAMISWHFLERPINHLKRFFQYTNKVPKTAL